MIAQKIPHARDVTFFCAMIVMQRQYFTRVKCVEFIFATIAMESMIFLTHPFICANQIMYVKNAVYVTVFIVANISPEMVKIIANALSR
jgi:hypothetical protein